MGFINEQERKEFNNSEMPASANVYWTSNWHFATPYGVYTFTDNNIFDIHGDEKYKNSIPEGELTEQRMHHDLLCILIEDAEKFKNETFRKPKILNNGMPNIEGTNEKHEKKFNTSNMPLSVNVYFTDHWQFTTPYGTYSLQDLQGFDKHGDKMFPNGYDEEGKEVGQEKLYAAIFNFILTDSFKYRNEKTKKVSAENELLY